MKTLSKITMLLAVIFLLPQLSFAQYLTAKPMSQVVSTTLKPVQSSSTIKLPLIAWGGDVATIFSKEKGIFSAQGLNVSLYREDDFKKQVQSCLNGETPYLRGTVGMINAAADAFKASGTDLVIFYQMTWSNGGDALPVRQGKTVQNIKTVALQLYGPHMDWGANVFSNAKRLSSIQFKWTELLLAGEGLNPVDQFAKDASIDACFCIYPDATMLTSGGTIGTGSEGSVKGASILLSTKSASRIIADVYAVRKDYYDAHKDEVLKLWKALTLGEEALKDLIKAKSSNQAEYNSLLSKSAEMLLGSPTYTSDVEGMMTLDCEFVGFDGNVAFFTGKGTTRNFTTLNSEIQASFKSMGLLTGTVNLINPNLDYNSLKSGLKYATATTTSAPVTTQPKFDEKKVQQVVENKIQAESSTWEEEGTLFVVEIYFQPNQNEFSLEQYKDDFQEALKIAQTYSGAIVVVEGHSDRGGVAKAQKIGASSQEIAQIKQVAKNLSLERAEAVKKSFLAYCKSKGINFDASQLTTVGLGVDIPKYMQPKTEAEWKQNFRVVFRIKQLEAESLEFDPSVY